MYKLKIDDMIEGARIIEDTVLKLPPYVPNGQAKGEDVVIEFSKDGTLSYYFRYEYIVYTEDMEGVQENEGEVCEFGMMPCNNIEIGVGMTKSSKRRGEQVYQFDIISNQQISFFIKGFDKSQDIYKWLQKKINEHRKV